MKYQIDQSGKIEQTNIKTVIALSNDMTYTLLLLPKSKRNLQTYFRRTSDYKIFLYLVFAISVSYLINLAQPKYKVIIDKEYFGHEPLIKRLIIESLKVLKISQIPSIDFGLVGKSSPADQLAYKVATGKKKADIKITAEQVLIVFHAIKNDREPCGRGLLNCGFAPRGRQTSRSK